MNLENILSEGMEQTRDIPEEQKDVSKEFPPKLERDADADVQAPKLERDADGKGHDMRLGESVEVSSARHALESAVKEGNQVAIDYKKRDLANVLAKEAQKEMERKLKN